MKRYLLWELLERVVEVWHRRRQVFFAVRVSSTLKGDVSYLILLVKLASAPRSK